MKVTRTSNYTGVVHRFDLPTVTLELLEAYDNGEKSLEEAFPDLDPSMREFIAHGTSPDEQLDYLQPPEPKPEPTPAS